MAVQEQSKHKLPATALRLRPQALKLEFGSRSAAAFTYVIRTWRYYLVLSVASTVQGRVSAACPFETRLLRGHRVAY